MLRHPFINALNQYHYYTGTIRTQFRDQHGPSSEEKRPQTAKAGSRQPNPRHNGRHPTRARRGSRTRPTTPPRHRPNPSHNPPPHWPSNHRTSRAINTNQRLTSAQPMHDPPKHNDQPIQSPKDPPDRNSPIPTTDIRRTHNLPQGATQRTQAQRRGNTSGLVHPPLHTTSPGWTEVKNTAFTQSNALLTKRKSSLRAATWRRGNPGA